MADDYRRDYGAAGCAEGCATRGVQMIAVVGLLFALLRRKRGGENGDK